MVDRRDLRSQRFNATLRLLLTVSGKVSALLVLNAFYTDSERKMFDVCASNCCWFVNSSVRSGPTFQTPSAGTTQELSLAIIFSPLAFQANLRP